MSHLAWIPVDTLRKRKRWVKLEGNLEIKIAKIEAAMQQVT